MVSVADRPQSLSLTPSVLLDAGVRSDETPTHQAQNPKKEMLKTCCSSSFPLLFLAVASVASVAFSLIWQTGKDLAVMKGDLQNLQRQYTSGSINATEFTNSWNGLLDNESGRESNFAQTASIVIYCALPLLIFTHSILDLKASRAENTRAIKGVHLASGLCAMIGGITSAATFPFSGSLVTLTGAYATTRALTVNRWAS